MRQKRAKAYRKLMATFERHFGFRAPYQVLYTADFLSAAESFQLSASHGVHKVLQSDVKGMITQCCIKTLYDAKAQTTIATAKELERRRCGHIEEARSPADCVLECVGNRNKNRYVVATQDRDLRAKLREIPGVPLIYINRSVMVMEPPSPATVVLKEERERAQRGVTAAEAVSLGKRKRQSNVVTPQSLAGNTTGPKRDTDPTPKKRKRGPPQPNPLSMKRKKVPVPIKRPEQRSSQQSTGAVVERSADADVQSQSTKKKRTRKHKPVTITTTTTTTT